MSFEIIYGYPDVHEAITSLKNRLRDKTHSKTDLKYFKKINKCFKFLSQDPKHPGLNSHKIDILSQKYKKKIWESYLENNTPSAGRVFWFYGPEKDQILIAAIEPHPDPNKYSQVNLVLEAPPKKPD